MFKVVKKEIEVAGKKISLETGKIARQADGAIIAQCGETVVLATAVGAKKVNPDVDYFPLSVNYQEKYYAAGKIPGGYFKREARPTESETLISRLIDRPIRPLFPDEFKNEVQVLPTVISYDKENEADILSIIASSAALAISGMPFLGPVGASRVGFIDGKYVLNPSKVELKNSKLDLVVAGTKDAVLMVESEANGLTEEEMLNAFNISSSVKPFASDSTINTASLVPATTRSNLEFLSSTFDGFKTYFPSIKPTLDAPTGPKNGIPEIARAADEAMIDKISASFSLS